jgi:hypothetical protein
MRPVSIAISILLDKSPSEWESVDVLYEESEDFPERKSLWRSTITVNLSNYSKEFCLLDDEDYLLGYEEAQECGVSIHEPLPEPLEQVMAPSDAVSKLQSALDARVAEDSGIEMIELKMKDGQLSWCGIHYDVKAQTELVIDARSGELISKKVEAYS